MNLFLNFFVFFLIFLILSSLITLIIFIPIFSSNSVMFPYAINEFDIVKEYPDTWNLIKKLYIITMLISYSIFICKFLLNTTFWKNLIFNKNTISQQKSEKNDEISLIIGINEENEIVRLKDEGIYQNIFITGTIGSGKTSSAMYPFTRQLIEYKADNTNEKIAMLILDVKGNYNKKVIEFCNQYNREDDIITIDISGNVKYNPLDRPNLKPIVLANRLKTILTLFNKNNAESYWLDKAEQIIAECIKLCRLYNNGYVNFIELHKLIMFQDYYQSKIEIVRKQFQNGKLKRNDVYDLLSCINFFEKEFFSLDSRTISILKSEISRISNIFVSDYFVSNSFCPLKEEINFNNFDDILENGKIVVLNMNISEYKNLSKIIATYLKLDFQTAVMNRLNSGEKIRTCAFICDEYHEYITDTDADFFAQSREAKCINIVATQSYTSLINTIKDDITAKTIIQNLINKIWFRTDDIFTIEEAQKQLGKEEKEKISTTIAESAKETDYNLFTNKLISRNSNISESYSKHTESDYIFDTKFFSQNLKTFTALAFISNGIDIVKPQKLKMIPYFKRKEEIE